MKYKNCLFLIPVFLLSILFCCMSYQPSQPPQMPQMQNVQIPSELQFTGDCCKCGKEDCVSYESFFNEITKDEEKRDFYCDRCFAHKLVGP